jgi:hypothetical protein
LIRVAIVGRLVRVIEYRHSRSHATEPEPAIEILLAGNGVKDDLSMPFGRSHEALDVFTAQAGALMRRMNGDIADV